MASYKVNFKCNNCSHVFTKELQRGTVASGRAGECPVCGCDQDSVGAHGSKIGVFQIVGEAKPKNKIELLLEEIVEGINHKL